MANPNFDNRTLFHGDNLDFLRGMDSETVHLIATDPPFNKGKDFHATPDSLAAGAKFEDRWNWDQDVHEDWVDAIADDWEAPSWVIEAARVASGDDMAAYLCWLGVRLFEMHRVLREDGSLYLHIDHTAHAWVKALLDSIFGRKNFRNEIIWCYRAVPRLDFARKHDTILRYSKSDDRIFRRQFVPYSDASQKLVKGRGGVSIDGKPRDLKRGAAMPDWWTDINSLQTWSPQRRGYPTQKPLELYERIIEASSDPGDIVLDPFCGCATTPVAAERLGRQWIGMDIWSGAHQEVLDRLRDEGLAGPDGETERLMTFGQITYATEPPERTDGGQMAAPPLVLKLQIPEPSGPKMSRAEMFEVLIRNNGTVCQGCDREFDDQRYLELDHNTPRADRGINHISNRVLLCGPCNKLKSNIFTLSGLRRENQKRGYMAG